MSGFNTKERNNYGEYEITFYTENHEDFKKVQDLCRKLIDHAKPYEPEGDLISRSALKKKVENLVVGGAEGLKDYYENGSKSDENAWIGGIYDAWELIDTAPTVAVNCKDCDGYEAGYSAGLKDAERPQGEYETACNVLLSLEQIVRKSDGWEDSAIEAVHNAVQTAIKCMNGRSKGEWILNKDENPECPFCHHSFTYWGNYCGNCGADMRKGGAEE